MERIKSQRLLEVYKEYSGTGFSGILYHADAHDLLESLDPGTVDLAFLDPPFNLGKVYSEDDPNSDLRDPGDYESWMRGTLDQVLDALARGDLAQV